jgi:beta-lactamase regulating signal transducer with metallopeptidase domain
MTLLLTTTLKVSVLILLGLGAAQILRRRSAAVRHWVLATALLGGLSLPLLELALPGWRLPAWSSTSVTTSSVRWVNEPGPQAGVVRTAPPVTATPGPLTAARLAPALVGIWISGAAIGLGMLVAGIVRLRRLAARGETLRSGRWHEASLAIARALGLRRPVRLVRSAHPSMLVTWGTISPTVLLPADAESWSEDRVRAVLCHELAHICRGDWLLTLSARLLHCLNWFNPLLWHACRRLRFESECACDDLVLATGVSGPDYATHLLEVARAASRHHRSWSPAIAIAHPTTLEGRVRAMLNTGINRDPLTGRMRSVTLALVIAAALPLAVATLSGESPSTVAPDIPPPPQSTIPVVARDAAGTVVVAPAPVAAARGAAQAPGGAIEGVLYDQFGGLLPGASVTLTSGSGATVSRPTDRAGAFAFRDLAPGDYEVRTSLPGFRDVRNLIRAESGSTVRRFITMPIGSVQETIHVTCEARTLDSLRPSAPTSAAGPGMTARRASPSAPAGAGPRVSNMFSGGIGGQIKAPTKTSHTNPICPTGVTPGGTVVQLSGRIGIDGLLTDLTDVSVSPEPAYAASAMEAVRQWTFTPVLLNGVPIEAGITIDISYSWQ